MNIILSNGDPAPAQIVHDGIVTPIGPIVQAQDWAFLASLGAYRAEPAAGDASWGYIRPPTIEQREDGPVAVQEPLYGHWAEAAEVGKYREVDEEGPAPFGYDAPVLELAPDGVQWLIRHLSGTAEARRQHALKALWATRASAEKARQAKRLLTQPLSIAATAQEIQTRLDALNILRGN